MGETSKSDIYNLKLGKATSAKLVDRFGDLSTLRLALIENPSCLSEISGISDNKAHQILEQLELLDNSNTIDRSEITEIDESELYFQLLDTIYNIIHDNPVYAAKNVRYPHNANIEFNVCVDNDDVYVKRNVLCNRFKSRMRYLTHDNETDFLSKALDIASEYNIIYSKLGVRNDKPFRFCFNRWRFLPDSSSNYIKLSINRLESFLNKDLTITYAPKPEALARIHNHRSADIERCDKTVTSTYPESEPIKMNSSWLKSTLNFLWMKKLSDDEYAVAYDYVLFDLDELEFTIKSKSSHIAKVKLKDNMIDVIESDHGDILKEELSNLFSRR